MAENQKYFLDLSGLSVLWNKIKSSFADKDKTENAIGGLTTDLNTLSTRVDSVDNDVTALETTVFAIAPREVDYYYQAIEVSKNLSVGTIINVKTNKTSDDDNKPSGFNAGLYVVTGSGSIEYISTSVGDVDDESITAIGNRVTELENSVVKTSTIVDENGVQLGDGYDVTNNILIVAHDDVLDVDSDSVRALTHRAVAKKFRDLQDVISGIPKFKILVVDELPEHNISTSTIYLKRNNSDVTDNNLFTEYIYIDNAGGNGGQWEKLGEQTLNVSDIVTNNQLNNAINIALASYSTTEEMKAYVDESSNTIKSDILISVSETYATKEDVDNITDEIGNISNSLGDYLTKTEAQSDYLSKTDAEQQYLSIQSANDKGWMTEAEIISSIQTGNIGNAIAITEDQIDEIINSDYN